MNKKEILSTKKFPHSPHCTIKVYKSKEISNFQLNYKVENVTSHDSC